jgi:sugar phosphate isomerase/epimerase
MPKLAAFPKAYMDALCVTGEMSLTEWITLAATLDIDGLEMYAGIADLADEANWEPARRQAEDLGLSIPMLCCSPDFTHPDAAFRQEQVDQENRWIDMTVALGGSYCRVLSGQRRPDVSRTDGIRYAAECIDRCAEYAAERGIVLTIENHYKDNYWRYPEFAQAMEIFCELVEAVTAENFGVNYDPSNTLLAGEDPLELLDRVKNRVITMHASDRYLTSGTLEDLRGEELDALGYADRLCHGEIGVGLNDYDAIFSKLSAARFDGWISIEDGVDGMDQLHRSVTFLRQKIGQYWPAG